MSTFRNNTYELYDSYFSTVPKTGKFYTISDSLYSQGPYITGYLGEVGMFIDNKIIQHERKVYTLFELVGDLGGILQIIFTSLSIFMNYYTNKLYEFITVSRFGSTRSWVKEERNDSDCDLVSQQINPQFENQNKHRQKISTSKLKKNIKKMIDSNSLKEESKQQKYFDKLNKLKTEIVPDI